MPRNFPTLHPFYYLDHFEEILVFLEENCTLLLGEDEQEFIRAFRTLGTEERALVVRLANRSGSVFRISALKYKELPQIEPLLSVLSESGFIRLLRHTDWFVVAGILTRTEIVAVLKPQSGLSGKPKTVLGNLLKCDVPASVMEGMLATFIVQERVETINYLFFLFFGKHRRNLQALALRDLGIIKTRSAQSSFEVRFPTRDAATTAFFFANLSDEIGRAEGQALTKLVAEISSWPISNETAGETMRDREICRLGARLEQEGLRVEALGVYRQTSCHPARERVCRILVSTGNIEETKLLLREMIASPSSDEELVFAEDFHARKFGVRKLSKLTNILRSARVIKIDEAFRDSAEQAAANYFKKRGEKAYRTENHLWASLFGLMFWDLLQGVNGETKHNEFEHRPTQLADGSFYEKNRSAINRQLSLLYTGAALQHIEVAIGTHCGKPNGVFRWRRDTLTLVRIILTHGSPQAIDAILKRIAKNPEGNRIGFPDLMVVAGDELRFIEIKAEGDQIRRHQLVQLQALENAGFPVEVVRVEWFADPDQEYVVVDVETTGGRAAHHRITEIGAVKVCRGQVLEKFSTLINPERRIPGNITRLTGISDQMVANSPKFADVAQEFRDFVGNAVFVAHNAQFDYGFIRQEYGRLGQDFRRPTLCTVVAMRKFFPGLPSYKLSGLTEYFRIPLPSHHRALCDAEATAELLKLVNGKRRKAQEKSPPLGESFPSFSLAT